MISFIVPAYNVRNYIEDCVESIVTQIKHTEYEIICIDDCSTDGTCEVIGELAGKYENLRLLKNDENRGVSYSRNRGLEAAEGDYIWFVDSDDMLCPNVVDPIMSVITSDGGLDMLVGDYRQISEGTKFEDLDKEYNPSISVHIPECWESSSNEKGVGGGNCWSAVFLRTFLIDNSICFNEKMSVVEDTAFMFECRLRCEHVLKCDSLVYLYRKRAGSAMHSYTCDKFKADYRSFLTLLNIYRSHVGEQFGPYVKEEQLYNIMHHLQQGIAVALCRIPDTKFVKKELTELKKKKIYPFKAYFATLKRKESLCLRIVSFSMFFEPCFWVNHFLFKLRNRVR